MGHAIACGLLLLAGCGVGLIAVQVRALQRHMRAARPLPTRGPGISILKPLCGLDDDLMANLESFAQLDWGRYEVLVGVRDARDAAYPVACRASRRWPERMRVVLQHGEPGLNPNVLAEDHVMGQLVEHQLRKRVAVAQRPITNLVRTRSLCAFCDRYVRWGTIQRRSIGVGAYVALLLPNPLPFALAAFALSPRDGVALAVLACFACKLELECAARRSLGLPARRLRGAVALLCKDGLLVVTWFGGLLRNVVVWRGTRLAVLDGTVLVPIDAASEDEQLERGLA